MPVFYLLKEISWGGTLHVFQDTQYIDYLISSTVILYLADSTPPEDEKIAQKIVLESCHFDLLDDVLHHENPHSPGKWCVAVPMMLRKHLLSEDAHNGLLAGHLAKR